MASPSAPVLYPNSKLFQESQHVMLIVCIWVKIADISATPALILKRYNDSNCSSRDCNISKYKTDFNLLLIFWQ